ncbi:MAG TPA: ThiF family adenylyltransferase [Pyrinomonadaceae bacterium]|nr:ThiF family adenylyltransferase [Pyrinomonadaceae bacterium]
MNYSFRISGYHHRLLQEHLFPGDGLEAVAFVLCGRSRYRDEYIFTTQKIVPVPYEICDRTPASVTWRSSFLPDLLHEASRHGLSIVKVHSHPAFYEQFSTLDDESDEETFAAVNSWLDDDQPHGSAIMLPDGRMFGRACNVEEWTPFSMISVAGDDLFFWYGNDRSDYAADSKVEAHLQLFGAGTTARLRRLTIGVVGCSGTGSFAIELLARLAVGKLVLIDHDRIEDRNLNRIANSKECDIGAFKVDVLKRAVESIGLGTTVDAVPKNLFEPEAVKNISQCDVIFGCMDTAEGRHLLNRIAAFYLIPYFDLGVHLAADGEGGISEASGVVHYLQPGGSSLLSRKAYTMEQVRAEGLRRTDPAAYKEQLKAGYIEGANESSPAVASLNSTIAGIAVNEFLARLHAFRSYDNNESEIIRYNFMETMLVTEMSPERCAILTRHVGRGDVEPLLGWPSLST